MSVSSALEAIYDICIGITPTYRHLAPQGKARPYIVLKVLPGDIMRAFVAAESFQQINIQLEIWQDWTQTDEPAWSVSEAVEILLDLQTIGGISIRLAQTPGYVVHDDDKGRRSLVIVHNYIYEELRAPATGAARYVVTLAGETACQGNYFKYGFYDGVPAYKHVTETYYLYRKSGAWIIYEVLGSATVGYGAASVGDTPTIGGYLADSYGAPNASVAAV